MCTRSLCLIAVCGVLVAAGCSRPSDRAAPAEPTPPASERPVLERAEPLPKLARDLLHDHMIDHGQSMENLLWSALMLDHAAVVVNAQELQAAPRIGRPLEGAGDTLNDALPARFFDLQDEMHAAAGALEAAARAQDDDGVAEAYGRLARTCVSCHALYLRIPGQPEAGPGGP
ncbi:cytochrome c [Haliangium sp.]|uniref:cytochrome c n=1 Tax=Haliangium sp. TaxID=2663208 RepID=UPI003D134F90